MKIYRLFEAQGRPAAFKTFGSILRDIDNTLNDKFVTDRDLVLAKRQLLHAGSQDPHLAGSWDQAYDLANKVDWDKAVEEWRQRYTKVVEANTRGSTQKEKQAYKDIRDLFDQTVGKINNFIQSKKEAKAKAYYETEFAPDNKSQLYYFCSDIKDMTSIMYTNTIWATQKDSSTGEKWFICLTSSPTNHPTRKSNRWPCGLILDTQKLVSRVFDSKFDIIPNFDWKEQTNPPVAGVGKLNGTVFFMDESNNTLAKRKASYFYIEFLNCGRIPLTDEMYEIWNSWYSKNESNYIRGDEKMISADDPAYFLTFKSGPYVKKAPKLKDLPWKLQQYIYEESVFNEKESRVTHVINDLNISGLVKGFTFNIACKPFIDANIPFGTSFDEACSKLGINPEVINALPFTKNQFQIFLNFVQDYIINSDYQIAYYEAPVPLKWSEN